MAALRERPIEITIQMTIENQNLHLPIQEESLALTYVSIPDLHCANVSYQKMTPLVFSVPFMEVEDHALVYGDRTARGTAGGRAGEYAGRGLLRPYVRAWLSNSLF